MERILTSETLREKDKSVNIRGWVQARRDHGKIVFFEFMGNNREEIEAKFGHILEAFQYGVPPHGGIASGLDRLFAVLLGEESIREVIAFPKTGDARDLMMNSPSKVSATQLKELHLRTKENNA